MCFHLYFHTDKTCNCLIFTASYKYTLLPSIWCIIHRVSPQKRGVVQQTTKPTKQQKPAKSKTHTTTTHQRTGIAATLQKQNKTAATKAKKLAAARATNTTTKQKHQHVSGPVVTAQLPAGLSADSIFSLSVANNFKITVSNPSAGPPREHKPARTDRAKPHHTTQIIKPGQPIPVATRHASRPRKSQAPKPRIIKP